LFPKSLFPASSLYFTILLTASCATSGESEFAYGKSVLATTSKVLAKIKIVILREKTKIISLMKKFLSFKMIKNLKKSLLDGMGLALLGTALIQTPLQLGIALLHYRMCRQVLKKFSQASLESGL
jgi:hypothetical protein